MIKWLRRRRLDEQEKLLHQNDAAAAYLLGYFERDPAIKGSLIELIETNQSLASEVGDRLSIASADQLEWLLRANKRLRELYSVTPGAQFKSFDQDFDLPKEW